MKIILLDSSPLGRVTNPNATTKNTQCKDWLKMLLQSGTEVKVPEICDYELRRELLRANKTAGVQRLDQLAANIGYIPLTTPIMRKASELWAILRQRGLPTASDDSIDGDVILAAQALILKQEATNKGKTVIIATENVGHLSRLTDADEWQNITA